MRTEANGTSGGGTSDAGAERRLRSDARRNLDALLRTALEVFAEAGVDASYHRIAKQAGVGVGTVYRHFPQRSDLIIAVFRHEVDACVAAAPALARDRAPGEALALWMQRYVTFVTAKRGLAAALHSNDPAYESLCHYFGDHLIPALDTLLKAAVAAGDVRTGFEAEELLRAVSSLANAPSDGTTERTRRLVALLVDGLRCVGADRRLTESCSPAMTPL